MNKLNISVVFTRGYKFLLILLIVFTTTSCCVTGYCHANISEEGSEEANERKIAKN